MLYYRYNLRVNGLDCLTIYHFQKPECYYPLYYSYSGYYDYVSEGCMRE